MKTLRTLGLVLSTVLAIAACGSDDDDGGGGGPPPPATTAEGAYEGTLTGSGSNAFRLLVLESGEFWALFGTQTSSALLVAGFGQGTGVSSNGTFTSTDFKDFSDMPATAGRVDASYNASSHSMSGTVSSSAGSVGFAGGAIASSLYDYDTAADIATIVGSWVLTDLDGEALSLSIASSGALTATSAGCVITGTAMPRPSGRNVFNLSLTFGGAPCDLPGQSATGIAVAYPLASGGTQLVVAAVDSTRSYGAAAIGTR